MGELDASLQPDAHQPGLLGRRERLDVDELDRRTGERRHPDERGSRLRRQRRQAPHDQLLQVGRDRKRVRRRSCSPSFASSCAISSA